eukprot:scaffold34628_cov166-Amphora_coffeaeformis.AAC.6
MSYTSVLCMHVLKSQSGQSHKPEMRAHLLLARHSSKSACRSMAAPTSSSLETLAAQKWTPFAPLLDMKVILTVNLIEAAQDLVIGQMAELQQQYDDSRDNDEIKLTEVYLVW